MGNSDGIDDREIARELPSRYDGEPDSLRNEIIDEIRDHLQCAIDRERPRSASPAEATARALAKFGNPAQIARQLWLDAMKGTIMIQKLTLVLVGALTVVSASLVVAVWRQSEANQQLLQAVAASLDIRDGGKDPGPAEWNHLKVICQDEAGSGVEGVNVRVSPTLESESDMPLADEVSPASGEIDFGRYRYGEYTCEIELKIGGTPYHRSDYFSIRPGQDRVLRITLPSSVHGDVAFDASEIDRARQRYLIPELLDRVWIQGSVQRARRSVGPMWQSTADESNRYILLIGPTRERHLFDEQGPLDYELTAEELDELRANEPLARFAIGGIHVNRIPPTEPKLALGYYRISDFRCLVADEQRTTLFHGLNIWTMMGHQAVGWEASETGTGDATRGFLVTPERAVSVPLKADIATQLWLWNQVSGLSPGMKLLLLGTQRSDGNLIETPIAVRPAESRVHLSSLFAGGPALSLDGVLVRQIPAFVSDQFRELGPLAEVSDDQADLLWNYQGGVKMDIITEQNDT